jgi:sugar lactone lactonase YvrE
MKVPQPRVDCVLEARNRLGEGPIWDRRDNRLYWVDIRAPALLSFDPASGKTVQWPMPAVISCAVPRAAGGFLLALQTGLHGFDPETGVLSPILDPEPDRPENRLNDGKCDRQGRFWVGTMRDGSLTPDGALYRIGADRHCTRVLTGIHVPNSIAWSPDGGTFYFADTRIDTIWAFACGPATGSLGSQRIFAGPGSAPGRPDGATVDESGCLWSARYGGSAVVRFTPEGRVDRVVPLPVSQVTSCAFGGPRLDTLFVTTAAMHLSTAQLAAEPLAGSLFAIDAAVRGLPETAFAG